VRRVTLHVKDVLDPYRLSAPRAIVICCFRVDNVNVPHKPIMMQLQLQLLAWLVALFVKHAMDRIVINAWHAKIISPSQEDLLEFVSVQDPTTLTQALLHANPVIPLAKHAQDLLVTNVQTVLQDLP